MAETVPFKYRAFISYSHADTPWAKWLHRALESFRIDQDLAGRETETGTIPKNLRPIFRDRDDFTAGHALTDQTLAALDGAHALIVICSPNASKSDYVTEEVRLFKSRHPERPVIPLIVDGTPGDEELECFPRSLRFGLDAEGRITGVPVEILAADAREDGDGKPLALAKVVAGLLGASPDDIFRRAERERRRRQRRWTAGLATVALLLAGLAIWAEINRREAVAQREVAEHNFAVAKQGANALVFDIAQALRQQEGMRIETVRKILGTAEEVIEDLVKRSGEDPKLLHLRFAMLNEFATTFAAQGDTTSQGKAARKGLAISERLAAADPGNARWQDDLSVSYEEVGDVFVAQGDLAAALKAYSDGLHIRERLAETARDNVRWQRDLSISYEKIGNVLEAQGDLAGALEAYFDALDIRKRLTADDPGNAQWQSDLSSSYLRIGDALRRQDDLAAALKAYSDGLETAERLAAADRGNAGWQRDLSVFYNRIGDVLANQDELAKAQKAYSDGLEIAERLAKTDPSNAGWQRDVAVSCFRVAAILASQGETSQAIDALKQGRDIVERLTKRSPDNAQFPEDLAAFDAEIARLKQTQQPPSASGPPRQAAP